MAEVTPSVLKNLQSRTLQQVNQGRKRTHTALLDFTEEYGDEFVGNFTFHYPSQMERIEISVTRSQLLGGGQLEVDLVTSNTAHMIATLNVVLDTYPKWFNVFGEELEYDVLFGVYEEYDRWVNSFRKPVESSGDDTSGDSKD